MLNDNMSRNLTLYTLDEVNALLGANDQIVQYNFYKAESGDLDTAITDLELENAPETPSDLSDEFSEFDDVNLDDIVFDLEPVVEETKNKNIIYIVIGLVAVLGLGIGFFRFKSSKASDDE